MSSIQRVPVAVIDLKAIRNFTATHDPDKAMGWVKHVVDANDNRLNATVFASLY